MEQELPIRWFFLNKLLVTLSEDEE